MLLCHFRIHGKRHNTLTSRFCDGQHAARISIVLARWLQMDWYWIVNAGSYACLLKRFAEAISFWYLHNVEVKDVRGPGTNYRHLLDNTVQVLAIRLGVCLALRIPGIQVGHFHVQDSGL